MEAMRLILVRHGPAETRDPERWPDDLVRPLTSRGANRARRAAVGLARLEPRIERVLTSPATRCVETARVLSAALGLRDEPSRLDALLPEGDPGEAIRMLTREHGGSVVALVGHEPGLSGLAAALLKMRSGSLALKKSGACALELADGGTRTPQLRWWLSPAALRAIKQRRKGKVS